MTLRFFWTLLLFALSVQAAAQSACADRLFALQRQSQQTLSHPTAEDTRSAVQEMTTLLTHCMLWNPAVHAELAAWTTDWEPSVSVGKFADALDSPHTQDRGIVLPADFALYLMEIGVFVGHDAAVSSGSIRLPNELASTPYRRTKVVPLLTPFAKYLDWNQFQSLRSHIQCPPENASCTTLQGIAIQIPILFVLLHENAHQRLGHATGGATTAAQEMAADRLALLSLATLRDAWLENFKSDPVQQDHIRWMFDVTPALWLKADALRLAEPQRHEGIVNAALIAVANQRYQAVAQADPATTRAVSQYTNPEHRSDSVTTIQINVGHSVLSYVIDGIRVSPRDVPAQGMIVADTNHTIVALCSDGIAVSDTQGDPDFLFVSYDTRVSEEKLRKDQDEDRWMQVLAETSDRNLAPRSSAMLVPQSLALVKFGLAAWISPQAESAMTADDRDTVQRARIKASPLSSWLYSADRR